MRRLITATAAALLAVAAPAAAEADQGQGTVKPKPKLGRVVVVRATDGRVTVKPRGHKRFNLTKRPIAIPTRSVVDTTSGKVNLTSARKHGGTQSGVFSEGAFVVTQRKSDGLTDLTLSGGDFSACKKATSAGATTTAARKKRRRLFGRAHGRFRSRGRSSSATVKGTDWLTEDRCTGTVTQNKSKNPKSKVETATQDRLHFELDPGQTITYYCNVLAITPSTYCLILLAQPADGIIAGGILTTVNSPDYDLCVQAPDGSQGCDRNIPLTQPDEKGFRQAVFACPVRQVGRYVFAWSLDHQNLLYPSLALTLFKEGPNVDCQFDPPRPPAPSP